MSAPYTGGFDTTGPQVVVDGDFNQLSPCGPPIVSYPLKGDSAFSSADIIFFDETIQNYRPYQLGSYPNIQPWSANQVAIVIDQEFMVSLSAWQSPPLNTPYDAINWGIGWLGTLTNGLGVAQLGSAILVEVGELENMGQGIIKVKLKFATVPPTRNEIEQFTYKYPGTATNGRLPYTYTVQSRLQYDYFVFDDFGILTTPLFPAGNRLSAAQGLYPENLVYEATFFYSPVANAINQNIFLPDGASLSDPPADMSTPGSIPSATQWINWMQGIGTSNNQIPEVFAESSVLRRWYGNIWERRTRFVQVQ